MDDRDAQDEAFKQTRLLQLRNMLDLLLHSSQCHAPHCKYPRCRLMEGLFRHGVHCKTRVSGGCTLCKKMWYLMLLHAESCIESDCHVPRCKDLKEYLRKEQERQQQQQQPPPMVPQQQPPQQQQQVELVDREED